MHAAAEGGHVAVLQYVTSRGADAAWRTEIGAGAVHRAAARGHTAAIRSLHALRADISAQYRNGATGHASLLPDLRVQGVDSHQGFSVSGIQ